jgi:hypothetical protein
MWYILHICVGIPYALLPNTPCLRPGLRVYQGSKLHVHCALAVNQIRVWSKMDGMGRGA